MRIAIINDTHAGVRNDLIAMQDAADRFFTNIFFPELEKRNITEIIHLGDLLDRRKYTNHLTLHRLREYLFEPLQQKNMHMWWLVGNHDAPVRNSIDINVNMLFFREYKNIEVVNKATTEYFDNIPICLVPWICDQNADQCLQEMHNTSAQVCMGHFSINGFVMHPGRVCEDGIDRNLLDKFDITLSGHFHHKSTDGKIFYLGSPMQFTWQDYGDQKGFHIFDTETQELEFIPNPYQMFHRIIWNNGTDETDLEKYRNTYVKVVVINRDNLAKFDGFLKSLDKVNPISCNTVENFADVVDIKLDEQIDQADDTLTILTKYINNIQLPQILDPSKLTEIFRSIYFEAMSVET